MWSITAMRRTTTRTRATRIESLRCFAWRLSKFRLASWVAFLAIAPALAGPPAFPQEWLHLGKLAGSFGLKLEPAEDGQRARLAGRGIALDFTAERRDFLLNGVRAHLGFPVRAHGGQLFITRNDLEATLRPLLTPQAYPPAQGLPCRIVLDPGHGDFDTGAQNSALGIDEKDLNLRLAFVLREHLLRAGYKVELTRETDVFLPLTERPLIAAERGGDIFLCLHFNAADNPETSGLETFALSPVNQPSTSSAEWSEGDAIHFAGHDVEPWSTLLGFYVQRAKVARLGGVDRGFKRARFAVLRDLTMPGILIEGGYLSNPEEARRINSDAYLDELAGAIVEGVQAYHRTLQRGLPR